MKAALSPVEVRLRQARAELDGLRRAAQAGDPAARRALTELGERPPPPKPWSETDRDEDEVWP